MKPSDRRSKIHELVLQQGEVTVEDLVSLLNISHETVRRDLTVLADQGLVRKFHGGASLPSKPVETPFTSRLNEQLAGKQIIASQAVSFFDKGCSIFIDTGTTTLVFAKELAKKSGVTVITNSYFIADTISNNAENNRAFLIGGEFYKDASESVGPLAINQIAQFHATDAVITVGALTTTGIMDYDLNEAEIARAMIAQADQVTVLVDSSKFSKQALFSVCDLSKIHRVITDKRPPFNVMDALTKQGVKVIYPADS